MSAESEYRRQWLAKKPSGYQVWASMKARCSNPKVRKWSTYGGRGIKVCERWQEFQNFHADMGPRPPGTTLDRYPNQDGDYEPGNCRWATHEEQHNNKRDNHRVTIAGRDQTIMQWARESGINKNTLLSRVVQGWPEAMLLIAPNTQNRVKEKARTNQTERAGEAVQRPAGE